MADIKIQALKNGPYIVQGSIQLLDSEGNPYEVGEKVALCRCGDSGNKPFCDGTHARIEFQSAPVARN